jgi:hypothetical protein
VDEGHEQPMKLLYSGTGRAPEPLRFNGEVAWQLADREPIDCKPRKGTSTCLIGRTTDDQGASRQVCAKARLDQLPIQTIVL